MSYRVWSLIPPFLFLNSAQPKTLRHRSIVLESKAYTLFEYLGRPALPCLGHHPIGELLEDTVIPVCICIGKSTLRSMFAKTLMISLGCMRLSCKNKVTETFTVGQLSEHHDRQLVPAGKGLDILVSAIFL